MASAGSSTKYDVFLRTLASAKYANKHTLFCRCRRSPIGWRHWSLTFWPRRAPSPSFGINASSSPWAAPFLACFVPSPPVALLFLLLLLLVGLHVPPKPPTSHPRSATTPSVLRDYLALASGPRRCSLDCTTRLARAQAPAPAPARRQGLCLALPLAAQTGRPPPHHNAAPRLASFLHRVEESPIAHLPRSARSRSA